MSNKVTKILLFSGGSDSVLISYLYDPDYLVYCDLGTEYSKEEIKKIKESKFGNDPRLRILDFKFLGKYERESDSILPLRNLYLPMFICNEFPVEEYGDLDICLGATAGDRVLDKSPKFAEDASNLLTYLYSPQHWIPEGRKVRINIDYKKYTKTDMLKLYKDQGGNVEELFYESFSCYHPVDGKECWECKPCFRKYIAYALNGMKFDKEITETVINYIKREILPSIKAGTYGRAEEEKEILQVLYLYKQNKL
jgi:7-cyano-7-deazaguanine synthase in queuosine biosynthesis